MALSDIPPDDKRCKAVSRRTGERCKRWANVGLKVCPFHGGNHPPARDKSNRARAVRTLRELVKPIPGTDIEANPIAAFELEFRRTIGRIRYLDEVIAQLEPEALGWGVTRETTTGSGEFPGVDTERTAQVNIYYELQARERKHLTELIKIWIGAKLDVRKLEVEEQKVNALNGVIEAVVVKLGHDVNNPEVRRTVREAMLTLPVAGHASSEVVVTATELVESGRSLTRAAEIEARKSTGNSTRKKPAAKARH